MVEGYGAQIHESYTDRFVTPVVGMVGASGFWRAGRREAKADVRARLYQSHKSSPRATSSMAWGSSWF